MIKNNWKPKMKAVAIHFGLSVAIFMVVVYCLLFIFYPSFYFSLSGGKQGLLLMFTVDVILGPLLTFLVYNPKKPKREIISDLVVIALVQMAAFGYGAYTVYQERPGLTVLYDSGTATTLTHREIKNTRYKDFKQGTYADLQGVPIVLFQRKAGKDLLSAPLENTDALAKADKLARNSLKGLDKKNFEKIVRQQKKVWLIGLMGKYNGAFVVLDEKFQFLSKFGEKPVM